MNIHVFVSSFRPHRRMIRVKLTTRLPQRRRRPLQRKACTVLLKPATSQVCIHVTMTRCHCVDVPLSLAYSCRCDSSLHNARLLHCTNHAPERHQTATGYASTESLRLVRGSEHDLLHLEQYVPFSLLCETFCRKFVALFYFYALCVSSRFL